MKIKIGVFFGGSSVEHDVSIITAVQAMENINKDKYEVIPVYIDKERTFYTGHVLKEMDTYKVATVSNSTSTMHKLASTPITLDCFEVDDMQDFVFNDPSTFFSCSHSEMINTNEILHKDNS